MKSLRPFAIILFSFLLVSCGGGGSSSGASSTSSSSVDLAQFAGTYVGSITATVMVNGGSESLTRQITFLISPDGKTITVETIDFPLTSDSFNETVAIPLTSGGIVCTLNATIMASITFSLISGSVNGTGNCVVNGANVSGQLSGFTGANRA